jgi:anti-sigma factor RsiW
MKWQCALLHRWLPEYPDGDLPGWRRRWLDSHLAYCSSCRQELAELKEMVAVIRTTPSVIPGEEFWTQFSRDLHLQLVQAAQADPVSVPSPSLRRLRLPYLVGVPTAVALLVMVVVHFTGTGIPVRNQALVKQEVSREAAVKMAKVAPRASALPTVQAPLPVNEAEQIVPVALEGGAPLPAEEMDISGWDLDSELAGMTDQEKEIFLKRLHQRGKDGSCVKTCSLWFWS